MGFERLVSFNGGSIQTTVTNVKWSVENLLRSFLDNHSNQMKIIGLDTEWVLSQGEESKCATLNLCDGRSCLIIQLQRLPSIPCSLLNFLRRPDFTFVGLGIKDNLAKLEKDFGIGCRNAVELGQLASAVKGDPRLSFCGLDELVHAVRTDFEPQNWPSCAMFKDWGQMNLSIEQAEFAAINVYSYHYIGRQLLSR
ncbi:uncharacterized protein LOC130719813 [Lotus japonicus]|uniref:uncharacterized protein LOC130719813 n=1 Tax=Lotus japonicus TaxID=34305 RepID=UPI00258B326C|nr:uncharacterized protein LOC130719813 [Lotus japonicus]